jgi:hypothetical protein
MHISFMVPAWALIGLGTIAYPSIGALVASFLMRASNRRLPGFVVAMSGVAWPVTLAAGAAVFPLWLLTWFTTNYGQAIKNTLQNGMFKGGKSEIIEDLSLGQHVRLVRPFGKIPAGTIGSVTDQNGSEFLVSIPGSFGNQWIPADRIGKV